LSTLIEVHAVDEPGLVYKIASALASLGLDIVCAKIATEKSDALDVFYVTDGEGLKLTPVELESVRLQLAELLSQTGSIPVAGLNP
jgi:[protein-PII] uridylyltransferase